MEDEREKVPPEPTTPEARASDYTREQLLSSAKKQFERYQRLRGQSAGVRAALDFAGEAQTGERIRGHDTRQQNDKGGMHHPNLSAPHQHSPGHGLVPKLEKNSLQPHKIRELIGRLDVLNHTAQATIKRSNGHNHDVSEPVLEIKTSTADTEHQEQHLRTAQHLLQQERYKYKSLAGEKNILEQELSQLKSQQATWQAAALELQRARDEIEQLKARASTDDLTQQLAQARNSLLLERKQHDSAKRELAELKSVLQRQTSQLQQRQSEANQSAARLSDEAAQMHRQVDLLRQQLETAQAERDTLLHKFQSQQAAWKANLERIEAAKAQTDLELNQLRSQLEEKEQAEREMHAELDLLQEKNEALKAEQQHVAKNQLAVEKNFPERRTDQNEHDRLVAANRSLSDELTEANRQIISLREQVTQLSSQKAQVDTLVDKSRSDAVTASRAVQQNKQLKQRLEELEKAFVASKNEAATMTQEAQRFRHHSEALSQQLNVLRRQQEEPNLSKSSSERNTTSTAVQVLLPTRAEVGCQTPHARQNAPKPRGQHFQQQQQPAPLRKENPFSSRASPLTLPDGDGIDEGSGTHLENLEQDQTDSTVHYNGDTQDQTFESVIVRQLEMERDELQRTNDELVQQTESMSQQLHQALQALQKSQQNQAPVAMAVPPKQTLDEQTSQPAIPAYNDEQARLSLRLANNDRVRAAMDILPPRPDGSAPSVVEAAEMAIMQLDTEYQAAMKRNMELEEHIRHALDQRQQLRDRLALEEKINDQLAQETDTIGEYITLYRQQRATLASKLEEKESECQRLMELLGSSVDGQTAWYGAFRAPGDSRSHRGLEHAAESTAASTSTDANQTEDCDQPQQLQQHQSGALDLTLFLDSFPRYRGHMFVV